LLFVLTHRNFIAYARENINYFFRNNLVMPSLLTGVTEVKNQTFVDN